MAVHNQFACSWFCLDILHEPLKIFVAADQLRGRHDQPVNLPILQIQGGWNFHQRDSFVGVLNLAQACVDKIYVRFLRPWAVWASWLCFQFSSPLLHAHRNECRRIERVPIDRYVDHGAHRLREDRNMVAAKLHHIGRCFGIDGKNHQFLHVLDAC